MTSLFLCQMAEWESECECEYECEQQCEYTGGLSLSKAEPLECESECE